MTTGMVSGPVRFSTAGLPEAQRVALWEDHNATALIGLRCRSLDDEVLEATEINLQLPRVHVARVTGNPHVVERTRAVVRQLPSEAIACYLTLVGEAFFYHDGGVQVVRPGQLIVCDADRPFMRGFSQGLEELAVKVPRQVWREITGPEPVARPRMFDFGTGDLQARTLARLAGRAVHPETSRPVDEDTLLDLLAGVVTGRPAALSAVHLAMAKAYAEDHLSDSGLNAVRIAKGIGISERHLSRVFAAGGTTVPQYLLARRLEGARALLAGGGNPTVAEVAARCGFGSAARFSHRFKERYGVRATDVLREARAADADG
ncbi:AraC family transcriptional regulator [Streptomyces sp. 900105755]|uniref:helix-turn-helix transcriptional regulator n=1 Tax=Streptomyces sp. NPDC001507 TaxID=3364579 RepID=UPI0036BD61B5